MDDDISTLTHGLSRCDEVAWRQFHERFYHILHSWAVSRGASACDAPAIVQGVYLRVLRHAKTFPDADSFHAWLSCLVRCEVIDAARKIGRRSWLNERFQQWQMSTGTDEGGAVQDQLDEAMEELEPADRSLVRRHYVDGWSQDDLAGEHNVSVKAIESKLARLRKRLRKNLEKTTTQSPI
jgi:RNA polymerase sigma-70 factor (ECF subfamily)